MNSHTPAEKQEYWQRRITAKLNTALPQMTKQLKEIVDMANHALSLEDRKRLRVIIAHTLGIPLSRLEPHAPTPEPVPGSQEDVHAPTTDEQSSTGEAPQDKPDDKQHVRSGVLPDEGGSDRQGDEQPRETVPA